MNPAEKKVKPTKFNEFIDSISFGEKVAFVADEMIKI